MRFLFLLAIPCLAQPKWVSIATPSDAYQYFRYGGAKQVELDRFTTKTPHPSPSFTYQFVNANPVQRGVCALADRPGVYWYSPDGKHLNGTLATSNPTEFNVSALQTGLDGFGVTASFAGSAARLGAIEVAYFTDRACSDAGLEYGFSRDLATNNILVYWSSFANCGNDAGSLCRKSDNPSLGDHFSNVQQENGGVASEHGFRIYGLDPAAAYTYKISVEHRAFRIEVWRGAQLGTCSDNEKGPRRPCSFLKTVQPWFPIDRLTAGYVVAGTQTVGDPGIAKGSALAVSDILVLK